MLSTAQKTTRLSKVAAVLAGAGILTASVFTLQANADQAETASQLSGSLKGIDASLTETTDAITGAHAEKVAEETLAEAHKVVAAAQDKVDTTPLTASVASLAGYKSLEPASVVTLASYTDGTAEKVAAAVVEADRIAAEKAAAAAAAAAKAKAERIAAGNTPDGARATAASLASSTYGWGAGEFSCLNSLWQKESGWSYTAYNASSGATGIPQALPGSKMASAGSDWKTNAATQISWGLGYIKAVYGNPCSAWGHSQAVNWY